MEKKNKYQEALNNIKLEILNCGCCEGDYDKNICKKVFTFVMWYCIIASTSDK